MKNKNKIVKAVTKPTGKTGKVNTPPKGANPMMKKGGSMKGKC